MVKVPWQDDLEKLVFSRLPRFPLSSQLLGSVIFKPYLSLGPDMQATMKLFCFYLHES